MHTLSMSNRIKCEGRRHDEEIIGLSLNYDDGDCTDVLPRRETVWLMEIVARGRVIGAAVGRGLVIGNGRRRWV